MCRSRHLHWLLSLEARIPQAECVCCPKNTVHMFLQGEVSCLNFFSIGCDVCLHPMDCCFYIGVTYDTHVPSSVTMWLNESLPCSLYRVRKINTLAYHFILCSSINIFGTQREHNFWKRSLSDTVIWRSDRETCGKCRVSDEMVNHLESSLPLHAPNFHYPQMVSCSADHHAHFCVLH
jgi:hypothetical protein